MFGTRKVTGPDGRVPKCRTKLRVRARMDEPTLHELAEELAHNLSDYIHRTGEVFTGTISSDRLEQVLADDPDLKKQMEEYLSLAPLLDRRTGHRRLSINEAPLAKHAIRLRAEILQRLEAHA